MITLTADWVWARKDKHGKRFPQTIAHRGFKAKHPENTMKSFQGAVEVGTHAIETDIHLSKDNVVVLSHVSCSLITPPMPLLMASKDPDLKRCFGIEKKKIVDCDWSYLSTLRTTAAPHEPMPRLADLLEYIAHPDRSHIWMMLDIKLDNDADNVMRLIGETIKAAPQPERPWNKRVVLGIWAAKYLPLCEKHVPNFPVSNICFSPAYARQFLNAPNVSFNMLQRSLFGFSGGRFLRDVKAAKRPLFTWTVNDDNLMQWCIQKELDGVITDNPKRFKEICDGWEDKKEQPAKQTWRQWGQTLYFWCMILIFSFSFRRRLPETVEQMLKLRQLKEKASTTRSLDP